MNPFAPRYGEILGAPIHLDGWPRKESRTDPNLANVLGRAIGQSWPELRDMPGVWVAGSTVWTRLYGPAPSMFKDLDLFTIDHEAYLGLHAFVLTLASAPDENRPPIQRSRGNLGVGDRVHTARGWVDMFCDGLDLLGTLRSFPRDGYAHCRAAFNPASGLLAVLPNDCALEVVA